MLREVVPVIGEKYVAYIKCEVIGRFLFKKLRLIIDFDRKTYVKWVYNDCKTYVNWTYNFYKLRFIIDFDRKPYVNWEYNFRKITGVAAIRVCDQ